MDAETKQMDREWTIALYQSIAHGFVTVNEFMGDDSKYWASQYVQLSEPVTVKWRPLQDGAVIQAAVAALDEQERQARIDMEKKVAAIRERKASLLAITYQSAE